MRSSTSSLFLLLTLGSLCLVGVQAWGADGHKMVAYLAQTFVTPKTLTALKAQLGTNNLWDIANWPDDYCHTTPGAWSAPAHYVDLQVNATDFTLVPACDSYCVVTSIWNYTAILVDLNARHKSQSCQSYTSGVEPCALSFLTHYTGDIHQPLHVSYAVDAGGNGFTVTYFGKSTNLHSVWDTSMIVTWEDGDTWQQKADELIAQLEENPNLLKDYQNITDVQKWANESFFHTRFSCYNMQPGTASPLRNFDEEHGVTPISVAAAASKTTISTSEHTEEEHHCEREVPLGLFTASSCQADLGAVYYQRNIPIITQRLGMAGARLANLLNSIYDPDSTPLSSLVDSNWRLRLLIEQAGKQLH